MLDAAPLSSIPSHVIIHPLVCIHSASVQQWCIHPLPIACPLTICSTQSITPAHLAVACITCSLYPLRPPSQIHHISIVPTFHPLPITRPLTICSSQSITPAHPAMVPNCGLHHMQPISIVPALSNIHHAHLPSPSHHASINHM